MYVILKNAKETHTRLMTSFLNAGHIRQHNLQLHICSLEKMLCYIQTVLQFMVFFLLVSMYFIAVDITY